MFWIIVIAIVVIIFKNFDAIMNFLNRRLEASSEKTRRELAEIKQRKAEKEASYRQSLVNEVQQRIQKRAGALEELKQAARGSQDAETRGTVLIADAFDRMEKAMANAGFAFRTSEAEEHILIMELALSFCAICGVYFERRTMRLFDRVRSVLGWEEKDFGLFNDKHNIYSVAESSLSGDASVQNEINEQIEDAGRVYGMPRELQTEMKAILQACLKAMTGPENVGCWLVSHPSEEAWLQEQDGIQRLTAWSVLTPEEASSLAIEFTSAITSCLQGDIGSINSVFSPGVSQEVYMKLASAYFMAGADLLGAVNSIPNLVALYDKLLPLVDKYQAEYGLNGTFYPLTDENGWKAFRSTVGEDLRIYQTAMKQSGQENGDVVGLYHDAMMLKAMGGAGVLDTNQDAQRIITETKQRFSETYRTAVKKLVHAYGLDKEVAGA